MSAEAQLLPVDAVLVHIGPYKTGTTAIQSSLHAHREALAEHGITYPGTYHRQMRPSWALLGRSRVGEADVPAGEWDAMVEEVRAAPGRVVISSEDFSSARPQHIDQLVSDLGPERVHVLIVARRLDRLLPSGWQERVKSVNETRTYDAWLREVLSPERESDVARTFWYHHGLENLIARWREALPPERVLVLVSDESDHGTQPRAFEQLLGLPEGQLTPGRHTNTSFSMERIELCRQVNLAVEAHDWVGNRRLNGPRRAMLAGMRAVPIQDYETSIPPLPGWTAPRLAELSNERARTVRESGVIVLGDPELLCYVGDETAPALADPPSTMPVSAAAGAMEKAFAGMLKQMRQHAKPPPRPAPTSSSPRVEQVSSRDLLREVARRQAGRLRRVGR
jgi:hypothetical protein